MSSQQLQADSNIVLSFAMTHTPGLANRLDDPPPAQVENIMTAFDTVKQQLEKARPEIMIALINDHFDVFSLRNLPTFAIGVADLHYGPSSHAEQWMQMPRRPLSGAQDYAKALLAGAIADGFDITRAASCDFNHNVMLPKKYLWPDLDIPVVPVFINCFCRPLPSWRRCYELGRSLSKTIASRGERVSVFASGGISHWPPFVDEEDALQTDDELSRRILRWQTLGPEAKGSDPSISQDFLAREKELAASDRELINREWDNWVLQAICRGDHQALCELDEQSILREGGNGGYEMAMWLSLMGVLNSAPAQTLVYEPVKEWMGAVSVVLYDA